jgi:hypothetical protein
MSLGSGIKLWLSRIKRQPIVLLLGALGAALTFIVSFGDNLHHLCEWVSLCKPAHEVPASASTITKVDLDVTRSFIEQPSVLGLPQHHDAESDDQELDAEMELMLDQAFPNSLMSQAVRSKKYASDDDYVNAHYDFATYVKPDLRYIVRYDKDSQTASSILLVAVNNAQITCTDSDLRDFPSLQRLFSRPAPMCLGHIKFQDFFAPTGGSLKLAQGNNDPAQCWGEIRPGGASGHGSGAEVTCQTLGRNNSDPIAYLVEVGIWQVEVAHEDYEFDESDENKRGSLTEFLSKVADLKVEFVGVAYQ